MVLRSGRKEDTAKTTKASKASVATVTPIGKPAWAIEKRAEEGDFRPPRVDSDAAREIAALRVRARLGQAALDARLSLPKGTINAIEAGKAIQNKGLVSRVKNYLKELPMPI